MPKELVGVAPGRLQWREYEDDPVGAGDVRVACEHAVAKHGTEMSFFKGYANPRGSYDRDLGLFTGEGRAAAGYGVGNMFCGSVVEAGTAVTGLRAGDRVFAYGTFRESHILPAERCFRLEPGVSWKSALCLDPAVFAMGAVRDGNVRLGDRVAVFGLGAIGLVVVQMARLAGASEVLAVDPIALRRDVASKTGATRTLDPSACDAGREIKLATGGAGVDVAIEYSGSVPGLQHAFRAVAFGGTVVCGAYPGPHPAGLDLGAEAHFNRPNVVFSRVNSDPSRDHPRWDEQRVYRACLRLIADHRLDGDEIVQPVVPFADLADEYPKIANAPETLVKLGVDY